MEILNRANAPFGEGVWSEIDEVMGEFLSKRLNLRAAVDFKDGYDYHTDGISTGDVKSVSNKNDLSIQARVPLNMIEVKKRFKLGSGVIEDIKRGMSDYDDSAFADAANAFAASENGMILQGIKQAGIEGIMSSGEVKSVSVNSAKEILSAVAKGLGTFNKEFVGGPFKLVISSATMAKLHTEFFDGISVKAKLDDILGSGSIVVNEDIGDKDALLLSQQGGDFEFYSGLDVSVGFEKEVKDGVELFVTQTCTFRVLGPEAAIAIKMK